jgi:drug/metabolite transporter (DMT)-like permease
MIFLLLSILFSTSLLIIFKVFERLGVNNTTGIVINYLTAATTGFFMSGSLPNLGEMFMSSWSPWALLIGSLFISLFFIVALSAQKNGMAITSVANKMSLVIPVIAAIFLYQEELSLLTTIGILMALFGVVFTAVPKKNTGATPPSSAWLYPALIFLGSGTSDTLIKYAETYHLNEVSSEYFTAVLFSAAALWGCSYFIFLMIRKPFAVPLRDVIAGIALGIPNYFSIHFLFLALSNSGMNSSTLIPVNNIGIVVASAMAGLLLFKERYTIINTIGLLLSITAILMIALG